MNQTTLLACTLACAAAAVSAPIACDRKQSASAPATTTGPSKNVLVKTVTVPVEGMSCAACVASVRKNLAAIDGVDRVEVSLEHRHAKAKYREGKISPAQIAESIQKLGYKVGEPKIEISQ